MLTRQLVNHKDGLYLVVRKFQESSFNDQLDTQVLMDWTKSNKILRANGNLFCCIEIEDLEFEDIIEEIEIIEIEETEELGPTE
jgi:hypothetical protein